MGLKKLKVRSLFPALVNVLSPLTLEKVGAVFTFGLDANAARDLGLSGPGYGGTSSSSFAIGTGAKAFTTQARLAYQTGARVRATSNSDAAKWMEGVVTTYVDTTLTISVDRTNGSGTLADWSLNIAGQPGVGDAVLANQNTFTNSTVTSSPSTGAMVVSGGVGVGGSLNVGGVIKQGATKATLVLTFDTYRTTYDIAALGSMTTQGLIGTFFIVPEKIDGVAGLQTVTSDELAIMQAKGWEIGAYASNDTLTQNMQQMYTADRKSVFLRFKAMDTAMRAKGIPAVSIAAMQRAWYDPNITEMARPWFKVVRVVDQLDYASYPIIDPCFISHGGGSASWSNADTLSSLSAQLDAVIAAKGLWIPVIHQIGAVADSGTVAQTVFDNFMAYVKTKVDAGVLRVTTLAKAVTPV